MKKSAIGMVAVVVGLAMLTLSAVPAPAAESPGFETYVVRSGDTLAKISSRIFGDARRWREILKANPQITNANRIFPGDTLLVPVEYAVASADASTDAVSEEPPAAPAPAADVAGAKAATEPPAAAPAEPARPAAVISPGLYRSAGYISHKLPTIAIVASLDGRMMMGTSDTAIVNASFPPGTRFTVVRADRRIFHPAKKRKYLGWLVRILGTAEVTCQGDRTSTVALGSMTDSAVVGDYLVPIDPNDVLKENELPGKVQSGCVPAGACDATIVAFNENRPAAGEQELAYIDRGAESGVAPGQRFTIYREVWPESRIKVGELQVLRAGENTSTVLITTSIAEVQVGYLLRAP